MDVRRRAPRKVRFTNPQVSQRGVTWDDVSIRVREIAQQIGSQKIGTILAIRNGGIIPAYYLAGILKYSAKSNKTAPLLCEIQASYYKDTVRQKHVKIGTLPKNLIEPILLVDDINDTSETILKVSELICRRTKITKIKVATLYEKTWAKVKADYCGERKVLVWLKLPWE